MVVRSDIERQLLQTSIEIAQLQQELKLALAENALLNARLRVLAIRRLRAAHQSTLPALLRRQAE